MASTHSHWTIQIPEILFRECNNWIMIRKVAEALHDDWFKSKVGVTSDVVSSNREFFHK